MQTEVENTEYRRFRAAPSKESAGSRCNGIVHSIRVEVIIAGVYHH